MIGENNFTSKQIGTFRLLTEWNSSQLSSTYKAEQSQPTPRIVVLKLFHGVHLPEKKRERFLQEMDLLKKVRHPHILPVVEGGFYEDMLYVVRAYAAHGSLRERIMAQPTQMLPLQEAVAIISGIGRALQFLHQINITHRNLKPENILFNEMDKILLADSSIVAIEDSMPVEQGHTPNSFPYMAPEQFLGKTNKESDQYALGCIAYELLTGIAPFAGSTFREMANRHGSEGPVPPTQLNMLLPEYMQTAILRAMAKQETERYASVKDFVAALTGTTKTPVAVISPVSELAIPAAEVPGIVLAEPAAGENSEAATLLDEQPPDTPAIGEEYEPEAAAIHVGVAEMPTAFFEEQLDTPVSANNVVEHAAQMQNGVGESVVEAVAGDEIATQPNLEAVAAPQMMVMPDPPVSRAAQPAFGYGAETSVVHVPIAQGMDSAIHTKKTKSNWLPLSRNFILLVGLSWILVALLIVSMVFIIIPSARPFNTSSGPVSKKATQQPTSQTTPTTQPTARPTVHTTPKPSPSPTLNPTPSPTPRPSPSPSPITVLALMVSPASLDGPKDCQSGPLGFRCTVTLSLPQNYPGNAHWTASVSGNISAIFIPSHGTLAPGQQQTVNILIGKSCPHNSSFIFSTQNSKVAVAWSC